MIRVIVKNVDHSGPAHGVNMPAEVSYRIFEIEGGALEKYLRDAGCYNHRSVVGAEIPPEEREVTACPTSEKKPLTD